MMNDKLIDLIKEEVRNHRLLGIYLGSWGAPVAFHYPHEWFNELYTQASCLDREDETYPWELRHYFEDGSFAYCLLTSSGKIAWEKEKGILKEIKVIQEES